MIKRDSKGRFVKGTKRQDMIGNSYSKGRIPWNKRTKGIMKANSGSFKKGNKPVIHKDTLLKRSNSIKKFWKENPEIHRKIIDATKTQITQEIVDEIINLYKKGIDGVKIAQKLHIGDKKIYRILEVSNLKYGQGKNPKSRNGFKDGHFPSKETRQKLKIARAKVILPKKDTSIEVKIQKFLTLLKIEYFAHKYISEIENKYCCDIFIPVQKGINQKTIIECDGDYFHGNPKFYHKEKLNQKQIRQIERDNLRNKQLLEKGFRVIRLWEHKIREMTLNNFKYKILEINNYA